MKICALSPFTSATKNEILDFLKTVEVDLIVLPGYSLYEPSCTPSPRDVQNVINNNVTVFMEESVNKENIPLVVKKNEIYQMPLQRYIKNYAPVREVNYLRDILVCRTTKIGTRKVTFILCGEINLFHPDGSLKHCKKLPSRFAFDILVNPAHSLFNKRSGNLDKKLASLSKKSIVIHVANNDKNEHNTEKDIRICKNGKQLELDIVKDIQGECLNVNEVCLSFCIYDVPDEHYQQT